MHPYVPIWNFVLQTRISLKHKYIYVATSKNACSTVKTMLIRMEIDDKEYQFFGAKDIHEQEYTPLLNPKQVGSFRNLVDDPSFFKFCIVRNPYDRLLSAYLDKVVGNTPQRHELILQLGKSTHQNYQIGFEEFVELVAEQPISMMDRHWRVQYYQTLQESMKYDLIGRVETLVDDIKKIADAIGRDILEYYDGIAINTTGSSKKSEQYYNQELKDKVYNKYRIDFECFGYPR